MKDLKMNWPLHAKWVRKEDKISFWYECSNCYSRPLRGRWSSSEDIFSTFCPYCGALMEGPDPEEE